MSWQKCVAAEIYSLAVPPVVAAALNLMHLLLWLSSLTLVLPPDVTVLLWVTLFRSWRQTREFVNKNAGRVFWLDGKGRIYVDEAPRTTAPGRSRGELRVEPVRAGWARNTGERRRRERLTQADNGSAVIRGRQHYTCCRSVRVPGCIAITLVRDHGKPLEILIFYRYHQRQFYRRLVRHLAYC